MGDKAQTQTTEKGATIPIPRRRDVMRALRTAAKPKQPEPAQAQERAKEARGG
jgi:hypothetical protein